MKECEAIIMEKFELSTKPIETPIVLCKTCQDKENLPYVYPSREKGKYLIICPICWSHEIVDENELKKE